MCAIQQQGQIGLQFLVTFCSMLVWLTRGQCCMPVLSETLCDFARYGPVPRVLRSTCLVSGGRGAICLLRWDRGLMSVRCVTGDGRD